MPILRQHVLVLLAGSCAFMVAGRSPSACAADAAGIPPLIPMREILSPEAYAKASMAILETMDREKLKVSHPDVGIEIDAVSSGSQGERIGLRKGDIVIAIDGNPILTDGEFRQFHAVNREQELRVLTPGAGERAVQVMPGKIGINLNEWTYCPEGGFSQSAWMLETSYLNGRGRDPRFDDDMLVACASAYGDGDLCETALARIQRLGGHPEPFFYLACVNGYHMGRFNEAIAYGETALASAQGEGCRLRIAQILCELCINSDHMDRAQELLTRYDTTMGRDRQLAVLRKRLAITGAYPKSDVYPLSSPAFALLKPSAIDPASFLSVGDDPNEEGRSITMMGNAFHCITTGLVGGMAQCGPKAKNGSLSGTVSFHRSPAQKSGERFSDSFDFGLTVSCPGHDTEEYSVGMWRGRIRALIQEISANPIHPGVKTGPDVSNHFRIAMIDNRVEAEVNGICVLRASTIEDQKEREVGFYLSFGYGMVSDVTDVEWKTNDIMGPRSLGAGKGSKGADDF